MDNKLISIMEIESKGWKLYIANFKQFLMPLAIFIAPYVIFMILQLVNFPYSMILQLLVFIAWIVISLWISILFIQMIDKIIKNEQIDLNLLYQQAAGLIWPYFLVGLLTGLIILGGIILLIIPGIIFAIWYALSEYIIILDPQNNRVLGALKESKELVKGRWGATFWRLIIPPLIVNICAMIVLGAINFPIMAIASSENSYLVFSVIVNLIDTICLILLTPLFTSFGILLYNSLKATKQISTSTEVQS